MLTTTPADLMVTAPLSITFRNSENDFMIRADFSSFQVTSMIVRRGLYEGFPGAVGCLPCTGTERCTKCTLRLSRDLGIALRKHLPL